jgi:hypothetical protein
MEKTRIHLIMLLKIFGQAFDKTGYEATSVTSLLSNIFGTPSAYPSSLAHVCM